MSAPASAPHAEPQKLTVTHWLILIIASIGFAFDIYELLMLPLILRPALTEFGIPPGSDDYAMWRSMLFYVPAFIGGILGLLGGYLTDRLGRRRVLTWSIMLYAFSAFAAGFSTSPMMLLIFRTTTFVGVCVEFVAAVAWLAELFPNPHQREKVLGYTQAFSSIGGLLVASAFSLTTHFQSLGSLPAVAIPEFLTGLIDQVKSREEGGTLAWRFTLMSGLIPAIPLLLIRPFLPESPAWARKKAEGTLRRPSLRDLFSPELRRATIVTMIMFACSYGAAFGAIQQLPDIVPGLTGDVKTYKEKIFVVDQKKLPEAQRKSVEDMDKMDKKYLAKLTKDAELKIAGDYTKVQEIGGLVGRFLLAFVAVYFVSRRNLLRVFQIPGLILMPLIFWFFLTVDNVEFFRIPLDFIGVGSLPITVCSLGIFVAGLVTVAQFSFWGNYLPTAYPVHLRGSGESFAANIGGRLIGTSFAAVTSGLAVLDITPGDSPPAKFAAASAMVALFVYLVGSIACCFLPEPKGEME